jgi:hypothetical protein
VPARLVATGLHTTHPQQEHPMNTSTRDTATSTSTEFSTPKQTRLAALALSCVLTLGMLLGIHTLAAIDSDSSPQMAQQAVTARV